MATFSWHQKRIVLLESMPDCAIINSDSYVGTLSKLSAEFLQGWQHLKRIDVLYQGLKKFKYQTNKYICPAKISYPLYSPNQEPPQNAIHERGTQRYLYFNENGE